MFTHRRLHLALAAVISFSLLASPVMANPGNGNGNGGGNGNSGNHGNNGGNHGNSGKQGNNDHRGNAENPSQKGAMDKRKNYGKPDHVETDISFNTARQLAVNYGLTGYESLPPGIAKNLARGKPLPPGIAKKTVPASMRDSLPYYPGYEWRIVGDDLVLIALSTAVVTAIINGVFD